MKLIIAGGRDYQLTKDDVLALNDLFSELEITEVVHGGAPGADRGGKEWAKHTKFHRASNLVITEFKADWEKYGKAAGPIRNKQMAKYANLVVLFPGGRGTASMHREATKAGLTIYDWRKLKQ